MANSVILPAEYSNLSRPSYHVAPVGKYGSSLIAFGMLVIMIALLFMLGKAWAVYKHISDYNILVKEGQTTQAKITDLKADESDESANHYYVYYQFAVPVQGDPKMFNQNDEISDSFYHSLHLGQTFEVLYSPSNPNLSIIKLLFGAPYNTVVQDVLLGLLSVLFMFLGWGFIITAKKSQGKNNLLVSAGQETQATLFDCWEEKNPGIDTMSHVIAYAFKVPSSQGQMKIITHAEWRAPRTYRKYKIGDTFKVRYLPENPQICKLIE